MPEVHMIETKNTLYLFDGHAKYQRRPLRGPLLGSLALHRVGRLVRCLLIHPRLARPVRRQWVPRCQDTTPAHPVEWVGCFSSCRCWRSRAEPLGSRRAI